MKNEFIDGMIELIHCYRLINDDIYAPNREVTFWRKRFLQSVDYRNISSCARETFIMMPANAFDNHTPEEKLEEIIKYDKKI